MKQNQIFKKAFLAVAIGAAFALAGCSADGKGGGDTGIDGGDEGSLIPNDGTTPGTITEGSVVNGDGTITTPGEVLTGNFICTRGATVYGTNPEVSVHRNGLVGETVTDLVNGLGGASATALLNNVEDLNNVIDGDLDTYSKFKLTLGLLGTLVSSVDEVVEIHKTIDAGDYAVFGVSFPTALVEASLLNDVKVTTYLGGVAQESVTANSAAIIDLLGAVGTGPAKAFIGVKTKKDYDTVAISVLPSLLSANVGDAMYVHELCSKGRFVNP